MYHRELKSWDLSSWFTFSSEEMASRETASLVLGHNGYLAEDIGFHPVPLLSSVFYTSSQTGLWGHPERACSGGKVLTYLVSPGWRGRCGSQRSFDQGIVVLRKASPTETREWNECGLCKCLHPSSAKHHAPSHPHFYSSLVLAKSGALN